MIEKYLSEPKRVPPLDVNFRPAVLFNRTYQKAVEVSSMGDPLVLALERADGTTSRFEIKVFQENSPDAPANFYYVEQIVLFLPWQRGGLGKQSLRRVFLR